MSLPDRVSPPPLSPDSDAANDSEEENYAIFPDNFIQPMVGREREKLEKSIGNNWEEVNFIFSLASVLRLNDLARQ